MEVFWTQYHVLNYDVNDTQNHALHMEENIKFSMQDTAITASLELPLGRLMAYLRLPTEIREMIGAFCSRVIKHSDSFNTNSQKLCPHLVLQLPREPRSRHHLHPTSLIF